jgi:hypothetical protein
MRPPIVVARLRIATATCRVEKAVPNVSILLRWDHLALLRVLARMGLLAAQLVSPHLTRRTKRNCLSCCATRWLALACILTRRTRRSARTRSTLSSTYAAATGQHHLHPSRRRHSVTTRGVVFVSECCGIWRAAIIPRRVLCVIHGKHLLLILVVFS